ncbi:Neither inactivation nor afterpotential protein G [Armadillidium vulgare]|nr:Neither inactivation nor afterpotential protein G [Armadillidium vulgare]
MGLLIHGKGPLTEAGTEGVAIAATNEGKVNVSLTLFSMGSVDKDLFAKVANIKREKFDFMFPGMENEDSKGFILLASCLHPKSRGFITFVSKDEMEPVIEPNYLQHPYDLECMKEAFWFAKNISETSTFKAMGAELRLPHYEECAQTKASSNYLNEEYLNCIIRTFSITAYHPIGTARMGRADDPETVVDSKLRVHGIENLRIVDASVLPSQVSGFPNSVIIIVAEKASDLIKGKE